MFFSSNLVKLDLDLDPDLDSDPHSEKLLDPDPHKRNANPQPWSKRYTLVTLLLNTVSKSKNYCKNPYGE